MTLAFLSSFVHNSLRASERARKGASMFGVFRRRDERVRAPETTAPAVPAEAYERLAMFIWHYGGQSELLPEDRALLRRLEANPPTWTNPVPTLSVGNRGSVTVGDVKQPFSSIPIDTPAVSSTTVESEQATEGKA
jgi:hypothetical protein